MSNTEKKLDALIDALGFDVDKEFDQKKYNYEVALSNELFGAACKVVKSNFVNYKLTKRNPKQTHNELIVELAQALYRHSVTAGMKMHTLNYNGTTLKYSFESGLMEIVTDEEI